MRTVAYIPARLASTRFPKRILAEFRGKPLFAWAYENALRSELFDAVVLLVDDLEVFALAERLGFNVRMTSTRPQNGTQRIIEALEEGAPLATKIVNLQADEPLLTPTLYKTLLSVQEGNLRIWTLKKKISTSVEIESPNVVKVVTNARGEALYFSRNPIPYNRGEIQVPYYKHVGVYAYTPEALHQIKNFNSSMLEKAELLEQLTPLYQGIPIEVIETTELSYGVDTPEDLARLKQVQ